MDGWMGVWRHYVVSHELRSCSGQEDQISAIRSREISYASSWLALAPHNESAWNYLASWFAEGGERHTAERRPWSEIPNELEDRIASVVASHPRCRFALEVLAKVASARGDGEAACQRWRELADSDPVRRRYWEYMADRERERERERTIALQQTGAGAGSGEG